MYNDFTTFSVNEINGLTTEEEKMNYLSDFIDEINWRISKLAELEEENAGVYSDVFSHSIDKINLDFQDLDDYRNHFEGETLEMIEKLISIGKTPDFINDILNHQADVEVQLYDISAKSNTLDSFSIDEIFISLDLSEDEVDLFSTFEKEINDLDRLHYRVKAELDQEISIETQILLVLRVNEVKLSETMGEIMDEKIKFFHDLGKDIGFSVVKEIHIEKGKNIEALYEEASERELSFRDFSPFEVYAKEMNDLEALDTCAWNSYESGVAEGIDEGFRALLDVEKESA